MRRTLEICMICTLTLVLAGCCKFCNDPAGSGSSTNAGSDWFPSQRIIKLGECIGCTPLVEGYELALVKETTGDKWRLWYKTGAGVLEEYCTGTVDGDKFECPRHCDPEKIDKLILEKASSSECGSERCVKLTAEAGSGCPEGGSGTGGLGSN